MKRTNRIRSFTGLLLVCFLFISVVGRSLSAVPLCPGSLKGFIKKSEAPVKSDGQYPCEEKESEGGSEEKGFERGLEDGPDVFFISLADATSHFAFCFFRQYHYLSVPHSCGYATDIPLYLAKKTLLV